MLFSNDLSCSSLVPPPPTWLERLCCVKIMQRKMVILKIVLKDKNPTCWKSKVPLTAKHSSPENGKKVFFLERWEEAVHQIINFQRERTRRSRIRNNLIKHISCSNPPNVLLVSIDGCDNAAVGVISKNTKNSKHKIQNLNRKCLNNTCSDVGGHKLVLF